MTMALTGKLAQVLFDELHRGLAHSTLISGIEHDPARVALDDGQVSHVVAAHLINAVSTSNRPYWWLFLVFSHRLGFTLSGAFS